MSDTLNSRKGDLEAFLQVALGRLAMAKSVVDEEQAGVYQIEGRITEVTELIAAETPAKKKKGAS